ncbi:MAG: hypothetical protein KGM43_09755 [Planctomycetota bacterium]|nr:hypothetical protein [Planctomycetota bacterium]
MPDNPFVRDAVLAPTLGPTGTRANMEGVVVMSSPAREPIDRQSDAAAIADIGQLIEAIHAFNFEWGFSDGN